MDAYLQRLQQAIQSATQGMTGEDLRRHREGKWCTGEILEHLYLTYTGTTKAFERGAIVHVVPRGQQFGC